MNILTLLVLLDPKYFGLLIPHRVLWIVVPRDFVSYIHKMQQDLQYFLYTLLFGIEFLQNNLKTKIEQKLFSSKILTWWDGHPTKRITKQ